MVTRMCSNLDAPTLLVGVQILIYTTKINMHVAVNIVNQSTSRTKFSTDGQILKKMIHPTKATLAQLCSYSFAYKIHAQEKLQNAANLRPIETLWSIY